MIGKTRQIETEPRGILVPRLKAGSFCHERMAPSAALAEWVEHYWFVGWDMQGHPPQQQETLPHPNVHLVIENDADGVYGVHTARYTKLLAGQGFAFGIKFRPGGFRPFFGRAVAELSDRRVALAQLFGADGEQLTQQLRACATSAAAAPSAMAALAQAFLLARLPRADEDAGRAAALVAAVAGNPALLTVDALAGQAGLNKRALQRLFQQYVGVGPKWVIKRYRMHEAVAQLQAGTAPALAQLALSLGYYDQAHFIKDFAALVGQPPGEYLRQLPPPAAR
ncbi:AraC family transcriptional regulator [Pseudoduganella sp. S-14]|uniref:AraC family transcriptional regulator n=1 Tax=Pseudoduganella sp. S-14 TaxID=3404065 RepID=UPI003CEC8609